MAELPRRGNYINGREEQGQGEIFTTVNPANGRALAEIAAASRADVDRAVESALAGQRIWRSYTPVERSRVLLKAVACCASAIRRWRSWRRPIPASRLAKPRRWISLPAPTCWSTTPGWRRRCRANRSAARQRAGLYPPRTAGRLRRHRRPELPDPDRPVEKRSGAGGRQCDDLQTERSNAAERAGAGENLQRSIRRPACSTWCRARRKWDRR